MNIRRMVLLEDGEKDRVKQEFEVAMNKLQRVNPDIVASDTVIMSDLLHKSSIMENLLTHSAEIHNNYTTFSKHLEVMDILGTAADFMEQDYNNFHQKISNSVHGTRNFDDVLSAIDKAWKVINFFTPLENSTFGLLDTLGSCIDNGLSTGGDYAQSTNEPINNQEGLYDDTEASNNDMYQYRSYAASNEEIVRYSPIFASEYCDQEVFYKYYYLSVEVARYRSFVVDTLTAYRQWYDNIISGYPITVIEEQPMHGECISILDDMKNTGLPLWGRYFQNLESMSNKIKHIIDNYGRNNSDRSHLQTLIGSLHNSVVEFSQLLSEDSMSFLWSIANLPSVTVDDLPEYIASDNPVVCSWIYTELKKFNNYDSLPQILYACYVNSHHKLTEKYSEVSTLIASTSSFYQDHMKEDATKVEQYLKKEDNMEKLELAFDIVSLRRATIADEFKDHIYALYETILDLPQFFAEVKNDIIKLFEIPLDSVLPIITFSNVNETELGRQLYLYQSSVNAGFDLQSMSKNFTLTYMEVFSKHLDVPMNEIENLRWDVMAAHDDLLDAGEKGITLLQDFNEDIRMDAEFYM